MVPHSVVIKAQVGASSYPYPYPYPQPGVAGTIGVSPQVPEGGGHES